MKKNRLRLIFKRGQIEKDRDMKNMSTTIIMKIGHKQY